MNSAKTHRLTRAPSTMLAMHSAKLEPDASAPTNTFPGILPGSKLEQILVRLIQESKWAPEQCSGWLKIYRPRLYVCSQTIYAWIYQTRRDLLRYLHCLKGKYRRTRYNKLREEKRKLLSLKRNISRRPSHIALRRTYGHWEGDTMHGKGGSGYIATFVERKSGYLVARLLPKQEFGSAGFAEAARLGLTSIPSNYRRTLTLDNGPEFGRYFSQELAREGVAVRHSRLGRPNDNAHIERFNRTVQEECLGVWTNGSVPLPKIQAKLASYLDYYNNERVHLGIQMQTPSQVLQRS